MAIAGIKRTELQLAGASRTRHVFSLLYVQVLIGLVAGILVGFFLPSAGAQLKPLGDAFVALVKMLVGPIVFFTVVLGICSGENIRAVGRIGLKTIIYMEVVSTLALIIGLVVGEIVKPGSGMGVDPATLDGSAIQKFTRPPISGGFIGQLLHIIPHSPVSAFADGDILQILFFSVLFGVALFGLGESGRPVLALIEHISQIFFGILRFVIRFAPIGAFGAISFTVGTYGLGTLQQLGMLVACLWVTCFLFVAIVLGVIVRLCGVSIWPIIKYFRREILVTLGTSSTEPVLPHCLAKLQFLGCSKQVTSITFPAGYSFNLDGLSIYTTMGILFIAQATGVNLSYTDLFTLLAVAFVTSKGAAGVAGAAIFVLAATLQSVGTIPVAGIALTLGVDRFNNEVRAVTNLIGNIVATIVVATWERQFDIQRARDVLSGKLGQTDSLSEQSAAGQVAPSGIATGPGFSERRV